MRRARRDLARPAGTGRYALGSLRRMRGAASVLPAGEPAVLDRLLDDDSPYGILRRDDPTVRTERAVWAARRT